jgi:NADPH:quinone reductase-like Zn-dependent oxidoreductase
MAGLTRDLHFRNKPVIIKQAAADIFEMHDKGQIRPAIMATYLLDKFQTVFRQFREKKGIGKKVMTTGRD